MKPIRKTKIVATVGPACDTVEILGKMIVAGMNVARLNLSHGNQKEHKARIDRLREAAKNVGRNVAIMIDTRGIEIRTRELENSSVKLVRDDMFTLYMQPRTGNAQGVSVSYPALADEVSIGDPILLDDGAMELEVASISEGAIQCRIVHGGRLRANKSVNLPDTKLSMTAAGPETREDIVRELTFAAENDVDYIAASFIQSANDINSMRDILASKNVSIPIIAKIENKAGVANMEEIVQAADGLMVARGDLGVELPFGDVPGTQKKMIRTTVMNGKPVITATQMLASMERNPKPTRAEASDVANAILDGTSAIMLSGETAAGKYPVESVETMHYLAIRAESHLSEYGYLQKIFLNPSNVVAEAVSQAAAEMVKQLNAKAIVSLTETGFTSRLISRHRPECPILAITASEEAARRLCMNWGVLPIPDLVNQSDREKIKTATERAKKLGYVKTGDLVIVTAGQREQYTGGTDMLRVISVE